MADEINFNGIQVKNRTTILTELSDEFKAIYGNDINLEQDTPDGQLLNIIAQSGVDLRELIVQTYNSFDPNSAVGRALDRLVAINGIERNAGSYTEVDITINTDAPVILLGLDQSADTVFTIQDDEGNRFLLKSTLRILSNQSVTTRFQAEEIGAVLTTPRTITTIITPVLGVTSVNNLLPAPITGSLEESDLRLRSRRALSVVRPSHGNVHALRAELMSVEGVEASVVLENSSNTTDANGIPAHSIWAVISGSASAEDIANAIYRKRSAGCGMRGAVTHTLITVDGESFTARWDNPLTQKAFLFVEPAVANRGLFAANEEVDYDSLKDDLFSVANIDIGSDLSYNQLFCDYIMDQSQSLILNNAGLTTGHNQQVQLFATGAAPTAGSYKISYNGNESAEIDFNETFADTLSAIQAVTGLSAVTSTSTSSTDYIISFPAASVVLDLLRITDNTLTGPIINVDVINTTMQGTTTTSISVRNMYLPRIINSRMETISTIGRNYRFSLDQDDIVINPIRIEPFTNTITNGDSFQLNAEGGFGDIKFAIGITADQPLFIPRNTDQIGSITANGFYSFTANPSRVGQNIYFFAYDQLGNYTSVRRTFS